MVDEGIAKPEAAEPGDGHFGGAECVQALAEESKALQLTLVRRFGAGWFNLRDVWDWANRFPGRGPSRAWKVGVQSALTACPGIVDTPGPGGGEGWRVSWPALVELAGGKPIRASGKERCPFPANSRMERKQA